MAEDFPNVKNATLLAGPLNAAEQTAFLKAQNDARKSVGLAPLTWSDDCASFATEWVGHNAKTYHKIAATGFSRGLPTRPMTGEFAQKYGENQATWSCSAEDQTTDVTKAVEAWLKQKEAFDELNAKKKYVTGDDVASNMSAESYAQIIWKNTTRCGAAKWVMKFTDAQGVENTAVVIVANYDPPGNVPGQSPN